MKISVITVCYNSEETIEATIRSVLQQGYPYLEYIIIDGKSNDRTLEIITKYKDKISKIISEKDEGMYDAINKGLRLATGEVVGLLHADDLYAGKDILSRIANEFIIKEIDGVYGDLVYVDRRDIRKIFRFWKSKPYKGNLFKMGWMPPHPTFYVRKEILERYGYYNTDFKISADYELMLRLLYKHKITTSYIPEIMVKMRVGGKSNLSISNRVKANKEDRLAWKLNGLKPGIFTLTLKPLSKIIQFIDKDSDA